jgi:hypothetical protein
VFFQSLCRSHGVKVPHRRVLFFRDFQGLSGGHLKAWDYFNHVRYAKGFVPEIYFSETSRFDSSNPWCGGDVEPLDEWNPEGADVLFVGGIDWLMLPQSLRAGSSVPIVNLVQSVRHADPQDDRFAFLSHRAVRICVSSEVAEVIQNTMRVNGPIYAIPNGLDIIGFPTPNPLQNRAYDIVIGGSKAPGVAVQLHEKLRNTGASIKVATEFVPRENYLQLINNAKVAVLLPSRGEGFFLPALEAMALETLVVCPDCVGNRSFCIDGHNCLRPQYTVEALLAATQVAMSLNDAERSRCIANARGTVAEHDISKERASFLTILDNLDSIWNPPIAK